MMRHPSVGEICLLTDAVYGAKEKYAYVTFYRGEEEAASYALDVFSPMRAFAELSDEVKQSQTGDLS